MISFFPCVPSKVSSLCVRLAVLLAAFAGLLLPASLFAQVTFEPNWVQQSPATSPSARSAYGIAYDAAHGQVVLFGGYIPNNDIEVPPTFFGDTWVWDGTNWTQQNPAASPSARGFAGMAYDAALGKVVLFGGSNGGLLNDTWEWDGSNWALKTPAHNPPVRGAAGMAYDAAHQQVVLFGGLNSSNYAGDTWVWDGTDWTQKSPAHSPPADGLNSMDYDAAQQKVILFGGQIAYNPGINQTWAWDGGDWTQQSLATSPSARYSQAMAYDAAYGQIVLFGGYNGSGHTFGDTWLWNGTGWTQEIPATSPSARASFGMAYDAGHGQMVLFGGADSTGNVLGDTWTWGQGDFGSQAIGSSSTQTLNFFISSGTAVGSIGVLTQGAPSLDFTDAGGSTCTAKTYGSDTNCTVNVKLKPSVAGLREGSVVFYSGAGLSGTQLGSVPIFGVGTGPQIAYGPGTTTAIAPTVNGNALNLASGVAVDGAGDLFIADYGNHRVLEVPAGGGAAFAVAVSGLSLVNPYGAAVDGAGNLYTTDFFNNRVVEVPAGGGSAIAIDPTAGGESLSSPRGVAVDGAGDLFIADFGNNRVVEVPAGGGAAIAIDPTVNGNSLFLPTGVAVDGAGDLFIADFENNRVVEVPAGAGAVFAIDPTVNGSSLSHPSGVAVDGAGDLFIADDANNRIVEVPAGGGAAVAIDPTVNGLALNGPFGVTVDGTGDLFIADLYNNRVVEIQGSKPATLNFPTVTTTGTTDTTDGTQTVEIVNIGNRALNFSGLSYPTDFSVDGSDGDACGSSTSLSAGQFCDVPVEFTPLNGGALSEDVTLTDNNLNGSSAQQSIPLTGTASVPGLKLAWAMPTAITYPTPLSGTQLDATANVAGTFTYNQPVGTVLKAGLQTLTATFHPTDTVDYSATPVQVTLQVNKGTPKIEWTPGLLQIDSKLGAAQLDAIANVPGKFVYTPDSGTEIKTTTETLKAVFTPKDTTDYISVTTTVALPVSVIKVSPTSINFGTVKLDSITTKDVTVSNLGPAAVTIYNPLVSIVKNGDSKEFVAENLCPKSLAAHKSCTIKVEFVAGPFYHQQSATMSVTDSSPGSPETVSLTALTKKP